MKKLTIIIIISFLSGGTIVFGQGQISLYQMQKSIPQANYINPAFSPKSKFIIGLPLISSSYISFEGPFAIKDVFTYNGDSLRIDSDSFLNSLKKNNQIAINGGTSLLFLGLNRKNSFMSLSLNSRIDGAFAFPGGVFELILEDTGSGSDGSKSIALNEFDLRATAFNELAFSYNQKIIDELIVGGRLKYLQGAVNINLENFNGKITSNIDSVNITMNPWTLQTSGIDTLGNNADLGYFLFQNNNVGFAIDLGAQYQVNDNIRVSASVLDLGSITWKDDTKHYEFNSVDYTFEGFDFLGIVKDDDSVDDSIFDQELDSLKDSFTPEKVEGLKYSTPLTGKFYLGGTYTLMDMHTFGAVFYGKFFKSNFTPALALTYNIALARILDVGVSASYRNKTFGNFGVGLSVKGGPVQIYALGENFESLFYPARARLVGIRVGLVLAFGKTAGSGLGN